MNCFPAETTAIIVEISGEEGLCCINHVKDSLFESRVIAERHEQLVLDKVQVQELAFG